MHRIVIPQTCFMMFDRCCLHQGCLTAGNVHNGMFYHANTSDPGSGEDDMRIYDLAKGHWTSLALAVHPPGCSYPFLAAYNDHLIQYTGESPQACGIHSSFAAWRSKNDDKARSCPFCAAFCSFQWVPCSVQASSYLVPIKLLFAQVASWVIMAGMGHYGLLTSMSVYGNASTSVEICQKLI